MLFVPGKHPLDIDELIKWADTQFWSVSFTPLYVRVASIPYHRTVMVRIGRVGRGNRGRSLLGIYVEWRTAGGRAERPRLEEFQIDLFWFHVYSRN